MLWMQLWLTVVTGDGRVVGHEEERIDAVEVDTELTLVAGRHVDARVTDAVTFDVVVVT